MLLDLTGHNQKEKETDESETDPKLDFTTTSNIGIFKKQTFVDFCFNGALKIKHFCKS